MILPDIEKRLEAFVRLGHGIIIFPGGVGTAEELLTCSASCTRPTSGKPIPIGAHRPRESADYFRAIDDFVKATQKPPPASTGSSSAMPPKWPAS